MKLIFLTNSYGGRIGINIEYRYRIYFDGKQPESGKLVTVELPGLTAYSVDSVLSWLKKNSNSESSLSKVFSKRREISEFSENLWRETVLDDYIECENFNETIWNIAQQFPAEDYASFGDKWITSAQEKLNRAVQKESGIPRISAFKEIQKYLERVYFVMDKSPYCLTNEIEKMQSVIDRTKFDEITNNSENLSDWIDVSNTLQTETARQTALNFIAEVIVKRRLESKEIYNLLHKFGLQLRNSTGYYGSRFWEKLSPYLKFEQNIFGKEIDITEAVEEKVLFNWDLLNAERVGTISHNRNALVIRDKRTNRAQIYISGERKLKFQVQNHGGTFEKFGCNLRMSPQDSSSIHPALLEVEKIDALANLNPVVALEKAAHLNLPKNHPVYYIAEKAKTDKRQSRVLADLLIELLIGVDADIARNLARKQSVGNRR